MCFGKWAWKILVPVLLLLGVSSCATVPEPTPEQVRVVEEAARALERGDFTRAEGDLSEFLRREPRSPLAPRARLLAGYAALGWVDKRRESRGVERIERILSMSMAPREEADAMARAYDYFLKAGDGLTEPEAAAEAYFMAAVTADIEYLKRMDEAVDLYFMVAESFPGIAWAEKARRRYETLQEYYRGIKGTPHEVR